MFAYSILFGILSVSVSVLFVYFCSTLAAMFGEMYVMAYEYETKGSTVGAFLFAFA